MFYNAILPMYHNESFKMVLIVLIKSYSGLTKQNQNEFKQNCCHGEEIKTLIRGALSEDKNTFLTKRKHFRKNFQKKSVTGVVVLF